MDVINVSQDEDGNNMKLTLNWNKNFCTDTLQSNTNPTHIESLGSSAASFYSVLANSTWSTETKNGSLCFENGQIYLGVVGCGNFPHLSNGYPNNSGNSNGVIDDFFVSSSQTSRLIINISQIKWNEFILDFAALSLSPNQEFRLNADRDELPKNATNTCSTFTTFSFTPRPFTVVQNKQKDSYWVLLAFIIIIIVVIIKVRSV